MGTAVTVNNRSFRSFFRSFSFMFCFYLNLYIHSIYSIYIYIYKIALKNHKRNSDVQWDMYIVFGRRAFCDVCVNPPSRRPAANTITTKPSSVPEGGGGCTPRTPPCWNQADAMLEPGGRHVFATPNPPANSTHTYDRCT